MAAWWSCSPPACRAGTLMLPGALGRLGFARQQEAYWRLSRCSGSPWKDGPCGYTVGGVLSRVPWGEGGQRTRLGGARGVWEPVPGGPDPGAKLGSSRRCCHLVATSGSSRRRAGSPGEGSSSAGAGGGGVDACPRPAPPQPHLGCCSVFAPPDVAPTAQDAASPASASVIRTRALLCCPGSMPGCSGSGEARGPDEPPPRPPEPCMGATDGGGQALPAPAFRRHLLRTYCAPGDAVLALAGLPSQRGPAQGREVTLEAPQVRAGVREGDGQKQSSVGAGGTRRLCRCAGW